MIISKAIYSGADRAKKLAIVPYFIKAWNVVEVQTILLEVNSAMDPSTNCLLVGVAASIISY